MILDLLDGEAHFLGRVLDEIEESLNVEIAHNLHVEYFVDELNALDANVQAAVDCLALLVQEQRLQKLRSDACYPIHYQNLAVLFIDCLDYL